MIVRRSQNSGLLEVRRFAATSDRVEMRANDDGATLTFNGFASVYDFEYDVAGGPERGGWIEVIAAGAGRRTLNTRPDVRLLVNHEGLPIARTASGTLDLEERTEGLWCLAPTLDLRNPKVQEVQSTMDRKDVDAMSYAFRVTRHEWNEDYTRRVIREYALDVAGSDVSIVTYPANPATVAQLRSAAGLEDERPAARGMSLSMAKALAARSAVR